MTDIHVYVKQTLIRRAIKALEAQAHDSAAHSFGADLHDAKDTQEWADAQELRKELRAAAAMRKVLSGVGKK